MSTVSCTFNGFYTFNNGWTWFGAPTSYGYNALGIDGYGRYRYFVMKVTTSNFRSGMGTALHIYFPWATTSSSAVGTRTITYSLNTTAPPNSGEGGASADNRWYAARNTELAYGSADWWLSLANNSSSTGGYTQGGITINTSSLQPNTTYYVWMYCGINYQIYVGNNSTVGRMSAKNSYTDVGYSKPSLSKTSIGGYYGGINWAVGANSSYPYIYMGWSSSGTFYKKANNGNACTISTDADTNSTYTKTLYVFRTNVDLGKSASSPETSYLASANAYRYGARIYNWSSSYAQTDWNSGTPVSLSGFSCWGYNTDASVNATLNNDQINGQTVYAVYHRDDYVSSSATKYWYLGDNTRHYLTRYYRIAETYRYGTGQTSGGGGYYAYSSTPSIAKSGWTLIGWTGSSSSTSTNYAASVDGLKSAWNSYDTVYGVFRQSPGSAQSSWHYYRGTSAAQTITRTITYTDKYLYGTGSSSGGTPTTTWKNNGTSCLANSSYTLQGWSTSESSTTVSYTDLATAVQNGAYYGVYKLNASSSTATKYWYRGSSTRNEVTQTKTIAAQYYYGKGSHSGGGTSYSYSSTPTITCASNSSYTLQGWTTNSSSTSASYAATLAGLYHAWEAGQTTLYGIYKRTETMTFYPQNGSNSGTSSTNNYCYGRGTKTYNFPTEPTLVRENHDFKGWNTSSTGTEASTWTTLWNAGNRTVYAVWYPVMYYGLSGTWKRCRIYVGVNGAWKPVTNLKYGSGGSWKSS